MLLTDPDAIAAAVARNLSALRSRRGLSLDQLAQRSHVSKGMLVQIEQGRTNPSIGTLCRIANALGVAVARLLEVGEIPAVRVLPGAGAATLWQEADGSRGRLLVGADGPDAIELWRWHLAAGRHYDGEAHPPGTREILHVVTGSLDLVVDGASYRLAADDCVIFRADRGHRYANPGPDPADFVMVVVEPIPPAPTQSAPTPSPPYGPTRATPEKDTP